MRRRPLGAVAAGHVETAKAGIAVLAAGGNAFDAAVAAGFAATVAEPGLCSLGGGGFLLAHSARGRRTLYDFFVQTPLERRPEAPEPERVSLEFTGGATQDFFVGGAAIATPGLVAGLCRVTEDLGRLGLRRVVEPAVELARRGVARSPLQGELRRILEPIVARSPEAERLFGPVSGEEGSAGTEQRVPELADTIESIGREGATLVYRGEIGARLIAVVREAGGHLGTEDLARYRVVRRRPLRFRLGSGSAWTNPAPALGGALVAFATSLYQAAASAPRRMAPSAQAILFARVLAGTEEARRASGIDRGPTARRFRELLGEATRRAHLRTLLAHDRACSGTTHVSAADAAGNLASLTLSNGEGSGVVVPGTAIMLNNMLGEEDLACDGIGRWRAGRRLSSMMAPTIALLPERGFLAAGSGGSNRIRSAMARVLLAWGLHGLSIAQAVAAPRLHVERGVTMVEPGIAQRALRVFRASPGELEVWRSPNLFFGGVHAVTLGRDGAVGGAGDPRRGGVCLVA